MAIIPSFFMEAVVALGIQLPDGNKHWIGTGFIVGRKETANPSMSTCYIISNKHVFAANKMLLVRFNSLSGELIKDYPVQLIDDNGRKLYSEHPDQNTDVVAIQILPQQLITDRSIWGAFDLDDHALTLEQLKSTGVEEGSLVYALGYPMNLVDTIKTPICRLGCVSRIQDAFILKDKFPKFLVDAQTFPGNSGGPIISRPEHMSISGTPVNNNANLIGILSAYIPYKDILVSQQTGNPRVIQTENSGLTIVHPVDRIKEVVELEWQRVENIKATIKAEDTHEETTAPNSEVVA